MSNVKKPKPVIVIASGEAAGDLLGNMLSNL